MQELARLYKKEEDMASYYVCQQCHDSKVDCDDSHCMDMSADDWAVAQSCTHAVIQCLVCERLWKGNRTMCEHSSSDVIAGFLRRVR